MTLLELLERLTRDGDRGSVELRDLNVPLLEQRLAEGRTVERATCLPAGFPPIGGPCLVIELRGAAGQGRGVEILPVGLGPRLRHLAAGPLRSVHVASSAPPASRHESSSKLRDSLEAMFESTRGQAPERRAKDLMDWIMDRIDASRCALVAVEDEGFTEPLAFHLRGRDDAPADPRHLPRKVLEHVARTRQPIVSDDTEAATSAIPSAGTVARQRIRSFMAVPVMLHHELLGIAFVDRFDRPGPFTPDQRVTFQALAYELSRPLLDLREARRRLDFEALRREMRSSPLDEHITSPATDAMLARARDLAVHGDENLLILGETGAGKEWVALAVHEASRRGGRFVAVNASCIPSEVFESEMMGTVRGAFTDARDRPGRIAEAEGGTLFIDEIGDLELVNQVKLLRFLQDRRITPVGGQGERFVDVRIVAATNRPVAELVRRGSFRADLLHRFGPPLVVAPLRAPREEIVPLALAWLRTKCRERGLAMPALDPAAVDLLASHRWPGNVRQLQMVVSNALILARGASVLRRSHFEELLGSEAGADEAAPARPVAATWKELQQQLGSAEADWLKAALAAAGGNVDALARRIECASTTLRRALARHGLSGGR